MTSLLAILVFFPLIYFLSNYEYCYLLFSSTLSPTLSTAHFVVCVLHSFPFLQPNLTYLYLRACTLLSSSHLSLPLFSYSLTPYSAKIFFVFLFPSLVHTSLPVYLYHTHTLSLSLTHSLPPSLIHCLSLPLTHSLHPSHTHSLSFPLFHSSSLLPFSRASFPRPRKEKVFFPAPAPAPVITAPYATDGNEKCPMCTKSVFRVERVICSGASWHKSCFSKCNRVSKCRFVFTSFVPFLCFSYCIRLEVFLFRLVSVFFSIPFIHCWF
jgi:hypothetical protein